VGLGKRVTSANCWLTPVNDLDTAQEVAFWWSWWLHLH